jgi:hypothetical protein
MFKIIGLITVAALISCAALLFAGASSRLESDTPNAAVKGDRLDIRARGGACSQRAWPHYESACLYDDAQPAGEARKVRIVFTDRLPL